MHDLIKVPSDKSRILVTGGAGFIGSAACRYLIQNTPANVCVFDNLTYSGNLRSLDTIKDSPRFQFVKGDVADASACRSVIDKFQPTAIMHLAAESHVDRSIDGPLIFVKTNIEGTAHLLEESLRYWKNLRASHQNEFRFLHVSTDEVFGSLGATGLFSESTRYDPRSPYSASKAASDHLVRAWHHTYGLPVIITNCSNNFGPYQFPEKLIPVVILNAIQNKPIPLYGSGENIRDWIFVDDHVRGLLAALYAGTIGETYLLGANSEKTNKELVHLICRYLKEQNHTSHDPLKLITQVADRPGHDLRYAIDASKAQKELQWKPLYRFEEALGLTIKWYLNNKEWIESCAAKPSERLGMNRTQI